MFVMFEILQEYIEVRGFIYDKAIEKKYWSKLFSALEQKTSSAL